MKDILQRKVKNLRMHDGTQLGMSTVSTLDAGVHGVTMTLLPMGVLIVFPDIATGTYSPTLAKLPHGRTFIVGYGNCVSWEMEVE